VNVLAEVRRRWPLALLAGVALVAVAAPRVASFYTDFLWFRSVGYRERFLDLLYTRFGLGIASGIAMAALVWGNLWLVRRLQPELRYPSEAEELIERYRRAAEPVYGAAALAVALGAGVLAGVALVGQWRTYLLWANGGSFGLEDPQFGRDLGFFVFDLPFLTMVNGWLFSAISATILLVGGAHYLLGGIRPQAPGQKITAAANVHVSVLLAALVAVRAWGFWLDRYHLSYSDRGVVTGLSYTDVNASLRAFTLLTAIAAVCVLLFLANTRVRGWILPSAGVAILLVASLVLGGAYPAAIQALRVNPQELPRERPFIERNLAYTRYAYAIDTAEESLDGSGGHVTYESFPAAVDLDRDEVNANAGTLEAIRLWDPATLQTTYNQLQELRPHYEFRDVDVDRYTIDGEPQQVMVSVRELDVSDLQEPSWQNRALAYTHGYGVVSSTVSTAAGNGQPEFLSRDIPNQGVPELDLEQPRVYFGELPPPYSIVGTQEDELDFEREDGGQAFNRYDGRDGVPIGGPLARLAFALRYAEPNIVLSGLIESDSRILFNRGIRQRVQLIAPFLQLDHDPYPIVVDGRIKWVQDAYTTTDMIPYSERVDLGEVTRVRERRTQLVQAVDGSLVEQEEILDLIALQGQANYIRNSVKAVVDAYDGTVELYVTDPDDPLIQAWDRAFPGVLTPADQVPEEVAAHFRAPEDMFRVQARMLQRYHIPDATGFYTASDRWELPTDSAFAANNDGQAGNERTFPPTYQLLRLPGDEDEDFSLIQPFVPANRPVLSAYMAARGDPDELGQIRILQMPTTRTVFGPEQIFGRINQDPEVSELITLLGQVGAEVQYGNLIVVPVADSLLYALPLFLRAEQGEIPELREVVLVYGDEVVVEDDLDRALESLFGDLPDVLEDVPALPSDEGAADEGDEVTGEDAAPALDGDVRSLVAAAVEAFAAADAALAEGDLGTYQEQVREAEALVEQVEEALAVEGPTEGG
jgi:uncharacterized protein